MREVVVARAGDVGVPRLSGLGERAQQRDVSHRVAARAELRIRIVPVASHHETDEAAIPTSVVVSHIRT